jgi:hypothetical protein
MRVGNIAAAAALATSLAASPALACRYNAPPAVRIARGGFDAVVAGTVEQASYIGERGPDWRPWRGTVRVTRLLRGSTGARRLPIGRTGSTAACDDGLAPPNRGETWILYLRHQNGSASIVHAFPVRIARSADPALAKALQHRS